VADTPWKPFKAKEAAHIELPHLRAWMLAKGSADPTAQQLAVEYLKPCSKPPCSLHVPISRPGCGVYALRTADLLERQLCVDMSHRDDPYPHLVVGTVRLWGKVVVHEHGYRAQFAYPDTIHYVDGPTQGRELVAQLYGVASVDGGDERWKSANQPTKLKLSLSVIPSQPNPNGIILNNVLTNCQSLPKDKP
jgi:hypothetical protein